MEELNLLQNRVKDTTHAWQDQSRLAMTILSVILILLLGGVGALIFFNQTIQKQTDDLTLQNQDLQKQINDRQPGVANATTFQAQLLNLKSLVNTHTYLSPLLNELGKFTYNKAQYLTMDANQSGKIHLEGRVSNYTDLGKLILGLTTSEQFKNVKLLSVSPTGGTTNAYQFAIDMQVSSTIFSKK